MFFISAIRDTVTILSFPIFFGLVFLFSVVLLTIFPAILMLIRSPSTLIISCLSVSEEHVYLTLLSIFNILYRPKKDSFLKDFNSNAPEENSPLGATITGFLITFKNFNI